MVGTLRKKVELAVWSAHVDYSRLHPDLTYLFWECTLNCNFFCKHCGSSAGRKVFRDELTTAEIKKTFKEISEDFDAKKIMIAVTGGEPLVRKDLFEVMEYASDLGFSWGMVTNGFLVTEEAVENMKKAGMKTVVVSIDGIGKTHDQFRSMDHAYDHAIRAVQLLAKGNFLSDLQITSSIHKGNIEQLEDMYRQFIPLGITSWRVMNVDAIGRAEGNSSLLLNGKELKYVLDFIKEKRKESSISITYGCAGYLGMEYEREVRDQYFFCSTGIHIASILQNGDIFVCPNVPRRTEFIQGNIKMDRFSTIWKNEFRVFRKRERTANNECRSCKMWDSCLGNSFHLWDFDTNKPKLCHVAFLQS